MCGRYIALLRGINVGRAKRISMPDLRRVVEEIGCRDARTLLNSGNVVFTSRRIQPRVIATRIENSLATMTGISARVTVFRAGEFSAIVESNPLVGIATEPSRLFVAFFQQAIVDHRLLHDLQQQNWGDEVLSLGASAAYLWCPKGLLESSLVVAFNKLTGDAATMRNWSTVLKIQAAAGAS